MINAQGFGPDSRIQSWSMAKTVTQALVGILVGQKRLDLRRARAPFPRGTPRTTRAARSRSTSCST